MHSPRQIISKGTTYTFDLNEVEDEHRWFGHCHPPEWLYLTNSGSYVFEKGEINKSNLSLLDEAQAAAWFSKNQSLWEGWAQHTPVPEAIKPIIAAIPTI